MTALRQQYLTFTNNTQRGRGAIKPLVDRLRQTEKSEKLSNHKTPSKKNGHKKKTSNELKQQKQLKIKLDMQRQWNRIYINWLKKCPGVISEGGGNTVTKPQQLTPRQAKLLTPTQRVTLAEWSLLLQTEELERTKVLLLEEREHFKSRIETMGTTSGGRRSSGGSGGKGTYQHMEHTRWSESPGSEMPKMKLRPASTDIRRGVPSEQQEKQEQQQYQKQELQDREFQEREFQERELQEQQWEEQQLEEQLEEQRKNSPIDDESAALAVRGMLARMKKIDARAREEKMKQQEDEKEEEEYRDGNDATTSSDEEEEEEKDRQFQRFQKFSKQNMENEMGLLEAEEMLKKEESIVGFNQENDQPFVSSSPVEPKRMLLWKKIFDSNSGHNYYYNRATGGSVWERPEDFFTSVVPRDLKIKEGI